MLKKSEIETKVKAAVLETLGKKIDLKASDSFIANLGFNSLRMVSLSLALEEQFGRPLLLNEWISQADDPRHLTIATLCDFVQTSLNEDV